MGVASAATLHVHFSQKDGSIKKYKALHTRSHGQPKHKEHGHLPPSLIDQERKLPHLFFCQRRKVNWPHQTLRIPGGQCTKLIINPERWISLTFNSKHTTLVVHSGLLPCGFIGKLYSEPYIIMINKGTWLSAWRLTVSCFVSWLKLKNRGSPFEACMWSCQSKDKTIVILLFYYWFLCIHQQICTVCIIVTLVSHSGKGSFDTRLVILTWALLIPFWQTKDNIT